MEKRIKLTIDDTLSFYNDFIEDYTFNENNIQTNDYFIKVPLNWIENGQLTASALERFYAFLYGVTWRSGNEDGSRYMPLKAVVTLLNEEQKEEWLAKNQCYIANDNGSILDLAPQEF